MLTCHLKPMLDARRMSMRAFAERIDYRFETVRKLCRNEIERIPKDLVERICKEFNCTPGELFSIETPKGA